MIEEEAIRKQQEQRQAERPPGEKKGASFMTAQDYRSVQETAGPKMKEDETP